MMDPLEARHHRPALDNFRDRLGEEFTRMSQSSTRGGARSPVRILAAALVVVALGAGAALAATQTGGPSQLTVTAPNGETQTIGQTPATVTTPNGETQRDVVNNGVVVACPDGTVRVIPEANPASDQARQDAQQATARWCQNAPAPGAK